MINYNFEIKDNNLKEKVVNLKNLIKKLESAVVAFSGGVDSTLLATIVFEVLKDNCIAIINVSSTLPQRELKEAEYLEKLIGIKFDKIYVEELNDDNFRKNSVDRCYHCKKNLYSALLTYAKKNNYKYVLDGSNVSDDLDYRPGQIALRELNIISPLKEAGLTKDEIRILSGLYNLPTKDKPSFACLSSRIPYNEEITREKLKIIESGEDYLYSLGFKKMRVRFHNEIARIEIDQSKFLDFLDKRDDIIQFFKKLGFKYITLDIEGYRMGSMNIFDKL